MAYASVSDLESYWRTLTDSEKERASMLLDYASVKIDARCASPSEEAAKFVSCDMAKTAMVAGADSVPVSSFSQTGGPYSANATFANPMGDLYWKSQYDTDLGISGVGFSCILPRTA